MVFVGNNFEFTVSLAMHYKSFFDNWFLKETTYNEAVSIDFDFFFPLGKDEWESQTQQKHLFLFTVIKMKRFDLKSLSFSIFFFLFYCQFVSVSSSNTYQVDWSNKIFIPILLIWLLQVIEGKKSLEASIWQMLQMTSTSI